jgi:predicted RNase H-like HicB family nuclease
MHYTVKAHIYAGEQSGFIAECVEFPVVTQGQTLDETVHNLREALALHLEDEDLLALGFASKHPPLVVNYEMELVCA